MNKDSERRRRRFACNGEVNFTHHKQNASKEPWAKFHKMADPLRRGSTKLDAFDVSFAPTPQEFQHYRSRLGHSFRAYNSTRFLLKCKSIEVVEVRY
jgi:hypothetical protein